MNRERILELADRIGHLELKQIEDHADDEEVTAFNMYTYRCGSVACLCGWTIKLYGDDEQPKYDDIDAAAELLGLSYDEAHELFHPGKAIQFRKWGGITPAQAEHTLRTLAAHGVIDWRHAGIEMNPVRVVGHE